jgi:hypothetical protein
VRELGSRLSRNDVGEMMDDREAGIGEGKENTSVKVAACSEKYNKFLMKLKLEQHYYHDSSVEKNSVTWVKEWKKWAQVYVCLLRVESTCPTHPYSVFPPEFEP